ncbi:MAG TPA: DUF2510 domain-containing protein [Mycobacteriales bacterium]|nr:DUF2510 domain-containing protein [Mycobacteriales bacterium]
MTTPHQPGWYADPDRPTSLQRYWDGERWTGGTRPTGYVTQPAGTPPVAPGTTVAGPGAAPRETGGPDAARRRLRTAQAATAVAVVVALVALVVLVLG